MKESVQHVDGHPSIEDSTTSRPKLKERIKKFLPLACWVPEPIGFEQRALSYKASLNSVPRASHQDVSVSSTHSTCAPSVTTGSQSNSSNGHSAIFSRTSVSTTLTAPSGGHCVNAQVDDSRIRLEKKYKGYVVYVGSEDQIKLPASVQESWNRMGLHRLNTDLGETLEKIIKMGIIEDARAARGSTIPLHKSSDTSISIRMSGRTSPGADSVCLEPTVWVICASKWACAEVRETLESLTWLTMPFEIHQGEAPAFCAAETDVDLERLDLSHGLQLNPETTMYINVEKPQSASFCGPIMSVALVVYLHWNRSTMPQYVAISTAHVVKSHQWWQERSLDSHRRSHGVGASVEEPNVHQPSIRDEEAIEDGVCRPLHQPHMSSEVWGKRVLTSVSEWQNMTMEGMMSFLGASFNFTTSVDADEAQISQTGTGHSNDTDHYLIGVPTPYTNSELQYANAFSVGTQKQQSQPWIITELSRDCDIPEGHVRILTGSRDFQALDGELLPNRCGIFLQGEMFTLQRIKLTTPLGSWVVKGSLLCGVIIAASMGDSSAYMMSAGQMIANIKSCHPQIESVDISFDASYGSISPNDRLPDLMHKTRIPQLSQTSKMSLDPCDADRLFPYSPITH
ncbi:uncharacterized protein PG998_010521 [Apiospora kogelbergensis]|uniref:uncharacterized protein n=1 Tax=Apiospora kogelbergensis TaxID=1337665 RepID=UPI00312E34AD